MFFWFLENITAREGTLFPQMRRKIDEVTKEIYHLDEPVKIKIPQEEDNLEDKVDFTVESAHKLLENLVKDEYQILHSKMVASALKEYAKKFGEDENLWFITGLLHDLDYYKYPDEHPKQEIEWFKKWGFPQIMIQAVSAHAYKRTGEEPSSRLGAALIATDELSGFLYAYSLMRPEKFEGMEAKSVLKKFKDKAFARKVDREEISYGIEKFGEDFSNHIEFLISVFKAMDELK